MAVHRDAIGDSGQAWVANVLTRLDHDGVPLFRPHFLGDKFPVIDFYVELVNAPATVRPFFFAQVKSTRRGYTERGERRLRVEVTREGFAGLIAYPAPTYLIAVDQPGESSFILAAVTGRVHRLRSFPTIHSLDQEETRRRLYDEVLQFWQTSIPDFAASHFAE